jgi:hypothetical protein
MNIKTWPQKYKVAVENPKHMNLFALGVEEMAGVGCCCTSTINSADRSCNREVCSTRLPAGFLGARWVLFTFYPVLD